MTVRAGWLACWGESLMGSEHGWVGSVGLVSEEH